MADISSEELIAGYVAYAEALAREELPSDAAADAYDEVERVARSGPPERAWELVVGVLERGEDEVARYLTSRLEEVLASLGGVSAESTGPLSITSA